MRLIHISDLHIRRNQAHNEVVSDKLWKIGQQMKLGDLLVVTGDITDDGRKGQYANATHLLAPFEGRIVLVPGNHDYGALGNLYSRTSVARFRWLCRDLRAVQSLEDPDHRGHGVEVLVVDSCLHTGTPLDFAQGRVGWLERRRLKWNLARIRRKGWTSVVALHHSPLENNWFLRLKDAGKFLGVVMGQADYVLWGHSHRIVQHYYPSGLPETLAQTWMYDSGALHQGEGPLIIKVPPKKRPR